MWSGAWGRKWGCKGVARGSQERRKRWVDPARSETPAGLRCVKCRTALPQNRAPAQGVDNALPHHRTLRSNRSSYDVLSGLRHRGRATDRVRARLAGAVDKLAAPTALLCRARLSLHCTGHARLRPFQRASAPRGLRAGTQHARHAGVAGCAGARQSRMGRARLGQPGGLEHRQPPPRALLRCCQPVHSLHRRRVRTGELPAADRSRRLCRSGFPCWSMGIHAVLRRELPQSELHVRGPRPQTP